MINDSQLLAMISDGTSIKSNFTETFRKYVPLIVVVMIINKFIQQ